ncbi:thioredoxin family protein [Flavobacterium kingsejongi]|uniref:Thioredoxin domain-containing protein n=1 Tax=Flavobacterium kingsejongi TaxID=1678728 RepID=A0A2S1LKC0_9FLAO|nr:thioredoxin family protein [Flavobacterium kingsejongi]AWG23956.1 hypothetical protein FK004_01330 [Flavobacterium kingsejongi]
MGTKMFLGKISRHDLQADPDANWFIPTYRDYTPDAATVTLLQQYIHTIQIVIYMGNWCQDCREQVPAFYKILDGISFEEGKLLVVGMDRDKNIPGKEIPLPDIQRIPTFIVLQQGKEIGRIVEKPVISLENDLLNILVPNRMV